jgi:cysteinyl-tRNA synthetase
MTIRIFNTLTRCKEALIPLQPGRITIYVCGPTAYDEPHLGHARSAVVFDVITRYLKAQGHAVTYVRNITDIDDKIIARAFRQNQDYRKLSAHYTRRYHQAMQRLNALSPDAEPKATAFILPMQDFIARLIHAGHAYRSGGNVYFAVESFKGYGRLSRRTLQSFSEEDTLPAETGKKHPADFALWKAAKPGEPFWPSPWGAGRPGWHIECSAMSAALLGEVFDIHGGGEDLIFPHHENEIAQSQSLSGKTPAKYWLHNGLVHINGEKMSKSTGNSLRLNDLLDRHPPQALRLWLLSKRYRHPMEYSPQALRAAARSMARLARFFAPFDAPACAPERTGKRPGSLWFRFCSAMDDDFNFPMALSVIFEGIRSINRKLGLDANRGPLGDAGDLTAGISELSFMCREILGLDLEPAGAQMSAQRLHAYDETGLAV